MYKIYLDITAVKEIQESSASKIYHIGLRPVSERLWSNIGIILYRNICEITNDFYHLYDFYENNSLHTRKTNP